MLIVFKANEDVHDKQLQIVLKTKLYDTFGAEVPKILEMEQWPHL